MRKVACGRQNRDFEIAFELTETAKLLDRCDGSLLAPDQKRGLTQTPQRVADIDVEMSRQECSGGVTSTALMRRCIVDLDEVARDEGIV